MKHWPSALAKIRSVHQKGYLSPVWDFQIRLPVKNLYVQTTLIHNPLVSKPILSQFQTWYGRGWISFRYLGNVFGSRGIVGCSIEILGVIGDDNVVLFELKVSRRFRISFVASSLSCSLISIYI